MKFLEDRSRDKYGRPVLTVTLVNEDWSVRLRGVVVTMPKVFREKYPDERYLVNNWEKPFEDRGKVTYFRKRADAIHSLKNQLLEVAAKRKVAV